MAGPESGAYGPSLYRDDTFRLSVKFSEGYPLEPPEARLTPRLGSSLGVPPHCPPLELLRTVLPRVHMHCSPWGASALVLCGLLRQPSCRSARVHRAWHQGSSKRLTRGIRQG